MREPIAIHSEEDFERAQRRAEELSARVAGDKASHHASEAEIAALAEAMLAFELRRDEASD